MEIFVDRGMGRRIGTLLSTAGEIVHLHDDHFPQNAEDSVWLTEVGKKGWIVLTKDKWIRRRQLERDALLAANLKVFCFMSGSVPFEAMAEAILKALPAIRRFVEENEPPFIAGVYRDGTVKGILP